MSSGDDSLRSTQVWFARAITTPESEPPSTDAAEIADRLTAGPRLSAAERLDVYRRGYHARLLECLADDYPALRRALGAEQFDALCRAYVARHPSEGPSLNGYGRLLEAFCRHEAAAPFPHRAFAADLARLEWAIVEVIHAPSGAALTLDGLRELPIEGWASARLVPTPALRLLTFDHPVNAYFQAFLDGAPGDPSRAAPTRTVVYRSGPTVWRMDLSEPSFVVLAALVAGDPLQPSLERAEGASAELVSGWFRDWVASGLFSGVAL